MHGRVALGLLGLSLGGNLDLNQYFSIGATATTVGLAQFQSLSINYYPGGNTHLAGALVAILVPLSQI